MSYHNDSANASRVPREPLYNEPPRSLPVAHNQREVGASVVWRDHLKKGPSPMACRRAEYLMKAARSSSRSMEPSLFTSISLKMLLIALNV